MKISDTEARRDSIVSLYRNQLINVAGFKYVRTFEMINSGNRTEYFLYFETRNKLGLSRMQEAVWAADPVAGQAFSDRTATNHVILIQPEADLTLLRSASQEEFPRQLGAH